MGAFGCLFDLLIGGIGLSDADILTDGAALDPGVLEHHTVVASEGMAGHILDGLTVHENIAFVRVIEAHQQVDESGLSTAGGAYNGHAHTGFGFKVKVFDELFGFVIGEGYMFDVDFSGCFAHFFFLLGNLSRFFQKLEDTSGAGQSVLKLGDDGADVVEGLHVLVRVGEQYGEAADGEEAAWDHESADQSHACVDDVVDAAGGGVRQAAVEHSFLAVVFQILVDLCETLGSLVLITEGLYDFLISDHLLDESGLFSAGLTLLPEHLEGVAGDEFGHEKA